MTLCVTTTTPFCLQSEMGVFYLYRASCCVTASPPPLARKHEVGVGFILFSLGTAASLLVTTTNYARCRWLSHTLGASIPPCRLSFLAPMITGSITVHIDSIFPGQNAVPPLFSSYHFASCAKTTLTFSVFSNSRILAICPSASALFTCMQNSGQANQPEYVLRP